MKVYEIGRPDSDYECDCTVWIATDREIKSCKETEYYVKELPEYRGMEKKPGDLGLDFIIS